MSEEGKKNVLSLSLLSVERRKKSKNDGEKNLFSRSSSEIQNMEPSKRRGEKKGWRKNWLNDFWWFYQEQLLHGRKKVFVCAYFNYYSLEKLLFLSHKIAFWPLIRVFMKSFWQKILWITNEEICSWEIINMRHTGEKKLVSGTACWFKLGEEMFFARAEEKKK